MFKYAHIIFVLCVIDGSLGIIYKLNDTEHEQLPPLVKLDDYGPCLEETEGIYCLASLEIYGQPENDIYNLIQEYSQHTVKHFNYSRIERGVCVSRFCKKYIRNRNLNINEDLEAVLEECVNGALIQKYNLTSRLYGMSCDRQTDKGSQLDGLDYLAAAVIIGLCIAVLIGSCYDYAFSKNTTNGVEKGIHHRILLCFSAFQNLDKLRPRDSGHELFSDLKPLHGIRAFAEILVVYGHTGSMMARFVSDPHTFEKSYESSFVRVIYSMTSLVQLFFSMSGFLMTYFLQKYSENHQISGKHILQIIFYRWWRLIPSVAIVLTFTATWYRHLASGPIWRYYITDGISAQCRQFYWPHIFFFNNYMINDNLCLPQTWHLATDMQLFIIGLIVHFIIRNRSWRFKVGALTVLLLIGIAGPTAHIWLQDLDGFAMFHPEMLRTLKDDTFRKYHILGYNNLTGFVVGMANGYLCYYLMQKKVEFPHFKPGNILSWFALPLLVSVFYVGSSVYEDKERPSLMWRILFASGHRIVIGLISSAFIMGIIMKFNGFSKTFLEWDAWVIPSKLSYCVFLVHVLILDFVSGARSQLIPVLPVDSVFIFFGELFFSYLAALVLHLIVEAPANQLLKILVGDNMIETREQKKVQ